MSSLLLFAGQNPYTPQARSRPSESKRCASSNNSLALLPSVLSSRIFGYVPRSSHVWNKGDQSMKGTSSASGRFSNTRTPAKEGFDGLPLADH